MHTDMIDNREAGGEGFRAVMECCIERRNAACGGNKCAVNYMGDCCVDDA